MVKIERKVVAGLAVLAVLVLSSVSCNKMTNEVSYSRARTFHDHGDLDKAIAIYQRLLKKKGDNSEVRYDLGVAYADKGEMDLALCANNSETLTFPKLL